MAWNSFATPLIGKAVRAASRLAHGGGSAFPGKIVERVFDTGAKIRESAWEPQKIFEKSLFVKTF